MTAVPTIDLIDGRSIPQLGSGVVQIDPEATAESTTPARIRENFEPFDFRLEPGDAEEIDALDQGKGGRTGPNPDAFAHVPA